MNHEEKERIYKETQDSAQDPLPEMPDEQRVSALRSHLRNHIGAGKEDHTENDVIFFIELCPHSSKRAAACQHCTCKESIDEESYRVAVYPGMNTRGNAGQRFHTDVSSLRGND